MDGQTNRHRLTDKQRDRQMDGCDFAIFLILSLKFDPVVPPGWRTETLPGRALRTIWMENSESDKPRFRRLQLQVGNQFHQK